MEKANIDVLTIMLAHLYSKVVHPEIAQILAERMPGYIQLIIESMKKPGLTPKERLILCEDGVSGLIKALETAEVVDYFGGEVLKIALIPLLMGLEPSEVK